MLSDLTTPSPVPRRFLSELKDMFQGKPRDFTTGSLGRAIVLLAIPMVLEMIMQSIFGVVDVYFVGKLGADAVAAVGMTDSLMVLLFAVGMGIAMSAAAMVARRIGEKKPEEAGIAAIQALIAGAIVSVPVAVLGVLFAPELLGIMGATESVIAIGSGYCAIAFGSNILILYLFIINAIFRGAGDAAKAMRVLWLANIFNLILDPMFIFGWGPIPEMGVTGAAVATAIGRGIGVAYQLSLLFKGTGHLRVSRSQLRVDPEMMRRLARVASPGIVQYLVGTASWMMLFRILASFGSDALAGYTIAIRIILFALLPSWGMGNAAATLVGQNLGARRPDRAERAVWFACGANAVFLGLVAVGMYVFAERLIRLFTTEAAAVAFGVDCLHIVSYTYILFAFGMVIVSSFNGAGDTRTPTWINVVSYWMLQLPIAYFLSHNAGMGPRGAFIAIAVAQAALAGIAILLFRRGTWKQQIV
ncbi:MAG: MATE family efflux transporter [Rhodothermales bacterium]|nr:MATE family efflux transporter [Rhodothermales bacterium]MDZ4700940.1 MATE family efflux transporter [Rhodothermales bacterium]